MATRKPQSTTTIPGTYTRALHSLSVAMFGYFDKARHGVQPTKKNPGPRIGIQSESDSHSCGYLVINGIQSEVLHEEVVNSDRKDHLRPSTLLRVCVEGPPATPLHGVDPTLGNDFERNTGVTRPDFTTLVYQTRARSSPQHPLAESPSRDDFQPELSQSPSISAHLQQASVSDFTDGFHIQTMFFDPQYFHCMYDVEAGMCGEKFETKAEPSDHHLKFHLRLHACPNPTCYAAFFYKKSYQIHVAKCLKKEEKQTPYQRHFDPRLKCWGRYYTQDGYDIHHNVMHQKTLLCPWPQCNARFELRNNLDSHMNRKHFKDGAKKIPIIRRKLEKEHLMCPHCAGPFQSAARLRNLIECYHASRKDDPVHCDRCGSYPKKPSESAKDYRRELGLHQVSC